MINLDGYKLVKPDSIEFIEDDIKTFYDIEVENDHTFFIVGENDIILSHNCDGYAIAASLMNFFNKYWPELFEWGVIYKVDTPLLIATNKKDIINLYSNEEFENWSKGKDLNKWELSYKKGLAALSEKEYADIIIKPKLTLITKDDLSDEKLNIWFGKDADLRKKELLINSNGNK